jgi:uncharacterized protein
MRMPELGNDANALDETIAAMQAGAAIIAQGTLAHGRWLGRADVLRRVERPSRLGAWSYEPLDTKLAVDTRAGAILQLCLYADLLGEIQGERPETMYVVPRRPGFPLEAHRVDDYLAYYRLVRRRLEDAIDGPAADADTYPEPVDHCQVCRWRPACDRVRRSRRSPEPGGRHLASPDRELQSRELGTLAGLAVMPLPLTWTPDRGSREGYVRGSRAGARPARRADRGAAGARAAPIRGRTWLGPASRTIFRRSVPGPGRRSVRGRRRARISVRLGHRRGAGGRVLALDARDPVYHCRWALDRAAERRGFEELIDTIMARLERDPTCTSTTTAPTRRAR